MGYPSYFFFLGDGLYDIAYPVILKPFYQDATLKALFHLFHVFLEALEAGDLTGARHILAPQYLDRLITDQLAVLDQGTGHFTGAQFKDLLDLGPAGDSLYDIRRQEAAHSGFHILDKVVDDLVRPYFHARGLCFLFHLDFRLYVETEDHRIRRLGQEHVRFGDITDAGVKNADGDFLVAKLFKGVFYGLERTENVGFKHDVQVLQQMHVHLRLERKQADMFLVDQRFLAFMKLSFFRDVTGLFFGFVYLNNVAGVRQLSSYAQQFGRFAGADLVKTLAAIVDKRAHFSMRGADHERSPYFNNSVFCDHGGDYALFRIQ